MFNPFFIDGAFKAFDAAAEKREGSRRARRQEVMSALDLLGDELNEENATEVIGRFFSAGERDRAGLGVETVKAMSARSERRRTAAEMADSAAKIQHMRTVGSLNTELLPEAASLGPEVLRSTVERLKGDRSLANNPQVAALFQEYEKDPDAFRLRSVTTWFNNTQLPKLTSLVKDPAFAQQMSTMGGIASYLKSQNVNPDLIPATLLEQVQGAARFTLKSVQDDQADRALRRTLTETQINEIRENRDRQRALDARTTATHNVDTARRDNPLLEDARDPQGATLLAGLDRDRLRARARGYIVGYADGNPRRFEPTDEQLDEILRVANNTVKAAQTAVTPEKLRALANTEAAAAIESYKPHLDAAGESVTKFLGTDDAKKFSPDQRDALLSLRNYALLGQGNEDLAQAVIETVRSSTKSKSSQIVEEVVQKLGIEPRLTFEVRERLNAFQSVMSRQTPEATYAEMQEYVRTYLGPKVNKLAENNDVIMRGRIPPNLATAVRNVEAIEIPELRARLALARGPSEYWRPELVQGLRAAELFVTEGKRLLKAVEDAKPGTALAQDGVRWRGLENEPAPPRPEQPGAAPAIPPRATPPAPQGEFGFSGARPTTSDASIEAMRNRPLDERLRQAEEAMVPLGRQTDLRRVANDPARRERAIKDIMDRFYIDRSAAERILLEAASR